MSSRVICLLLAAVFPVIQCHAQDTAKRSRFRDRIQKRFDKDGDGKLSQSERKEMRNAVRKLRDQTKRPETVESTLDPQSSKLYKLVEGSHTVRHEDLEFQRTADWKLMVRITWPGTETDEPLPVIVFSHGAGGSHTTYEPLATHWASHGYVVMQPRHGDSLSLLGREKLKDVTAAMRELVSDRNLGQHSMTRADDIKFILDHFEEIETRIPKLKGRLDESRIGMGGHSFGAHTTAMIGGIRLRFQNAEAYTDDRPLALLMISPQGVDNMRDERAWDSIQRPAMVITGSQDRGRKGQDVSWRLEAWEGLASQLKYLAFIEGAAHSFGGIAGTWYPGSGPKVPDHVYYIKSATLAFWDSQLKEDKNASRFLASDKTSQATSDVARITTVTK